MYHTAIVKAVLDSPEDFDEGISGVVLDESHTIVFASDHEDLNPSITKERLDEFVSDYDTVSNHPDAGKVSAKIRSSNGSVLDNL